MSYAERTAIQFADSAAIDAFARLRTSSPFTLFGWKTIHGDNTLKWDDQTTAGTATSTVDTDTASVTLAVANGSGTGTRVRQTKQRFQYEPGKSQLVLLTFVLGTAVANVTKRVGYFDSDNGLYLQQTSSSLALGIRTSSSGSPTDTTIAQASWNLDPLDGTGPSTLTLDVTKGQIFFVDFEWLGVGRVRFGFVIDGVPVYVHEVKNANTLATVYMSTPNLPVRYEISSSSAATASLVAICSSVQSEGGFEEISSGYALDRGITGLTTASNTSLYPLLAYRLKSTHLGSRVVPIDLSLLCTSTADFRWTLLLNPTVTGTALSFSDVANTAVQQATPTNATTVSGGFVIASGYASTTNQNIPTVSVSIPSELAPGAFIDGTLDVLVLAVQNLTAGAETYYASIGLKELT